MRITNWFKRVLGITDIQQRLIDAEQELRQLELAKIHMQRRIDVMKNEQNTVLDQIKRMTTIDVAAGREQNTVVLTGVLDGKSFVHIYDTDASSMRSLINHVKQLKTYGKVRHFDAPLNFPEELFRYFIGE
jgi:hypothetical protein